MSTSLESDEPSLRVVIDAVGFVRALINPRSAWGAIVFTYSDRYVLMISAETEAEIRDVLSRPSITRKFDEISGALLKIVDSTFSFAERVVLIDVPQICRDPNDDMVLATAHTGKASYIPTEDKDLLDMVEYEGIRIVTGLDLLAILRHSSS